MPYRRLYLHEPNQPRRKSSHTHRPHMHHYYFETLSGKVGRGVTDDDDDDGGGDGCARGVMLLWSDSDFPDA